jgi:hypothetical protein
VGAGLFEVVWLPIQQKVSLEPREKGALLERDVCWLDSER